MCCLFGLFDYRESLLADQKTRVIRILGTAAEERGVDAAGIAYNENGRLRIFKTPGPAHRAKFRVPVGANVIMGHTRMTTQGSAQRNRNNHPFIGSTRRRPFALAHNGVLRNDVELREYFRLPRTRIQTDSYVAVQLIERQNALDFQSLKFMAEALEGSFTITVLDSDNNLFIVKGDNPLCLYRYPALGLYLYASTEEILKKALECIHISGDAPTKINARRGEILQIRRNGNVDRGFFDASNLFGLSCYGWYGRPRSREKISGVLQDEIIEEVTCSRRLRGGGFPRKYPDGYSDAEASTSYPRVSHGSDEMAVTSYLGYFTRGRGLVIAYYFSAQPAISSYQVTPSMVDSIA